MVYSWFMDNFCVYRKVMLDVASGKAYVLCMDFGGMDMGFWKSIEDTIKSLSRDDCANDVKVVDKVYRNEWGVLVEIEIEEKSIFRCANWQCGKFALQHGAFIPSGLKVGDDPFEVQRYLKTARYSFFGAKWCLSCCQKLSK